MSEVRKYVIITVLACLLFALIMPMPAFSRTEERFELITGNTVFGDDFYKSTNIQNLFHQQSLTASDQEQSSLTFPNTLDLSAAGGQGDVGVALPSIAQNVSQSSAATNTGFFSANYNYRPEVDYGNVPVSTNYISSLQQAIQPAPVSLSLFAPEQFGAIAIQNKLKGSAPTNQSSNATKSGTPLNKELNNTMGVNLMGPEFNRSNLLDLLGPKKADSQPEIPLIYPSGFDMAGRDMPVLPNPGIGSFSTNGAGSTGASLTGLLKDSATGSNQTAKSNQTEKNNQTSGANQMAVSDVTAPQNLNYADFNFAATPAQISNMSLVERMWRNAHRGGTMGKAYAGITAAPTWIDPLSTPADIVTVGEHWYLLQSALNMCVPGTQILPRNWDLMF